MPGAAATGGAVMAGPGSGVLWTGCGAAGELVFAAVRGAGAAATGAARVCGVREVVNAGGRTGAVCGLAGVATGGWSAGRVTVPLRLKF